VVAVRNNLRVALHLGRWDVERVAGGVTMVRNLRQRETYGRTGRKRPLPFNIPLAVRGYILSNKSHGKLNGKQSSFRTALEDGAVLLPRCRQRRPCSRELARLPTNCKKINRNDR
jgi:hypothetical protein